MHTYVRIKNMVVVVKVNHLILSKAMVECIILYWIRIHIKIGIISVLSVLHFKSYTIELQILLLLNKFQLLLFYCIAIHG